LAYTCSYSTCDVRFRLGYSFGPILVQPLYLPIPGPRVSYHYNSTIYHFLVICNLTGMQTSCDSENITLPLSTGTLCFNHLHKHYRILFTSTVQSRRSKQANCKLTVHNLTLTQTFYTLHRFAHQIQNSPALHSGLLLFALCQLGSRPINSVTRLIFKTISSTILHFHVPESNL
jgi:hypothetical protein